MTTATLPIQTRLLAGHRAELDALVYTAVRCTNPDCLWHTEPTTGVPEPDGQRCHACLRGTLTVFELVGGDAVDGFRAELRELYAARRARREQAAKEGGRR